LAKLLSETEESRETNELALVKSRDDSDQLWNPQVKQRKGYLGGRRLIRARRHCFGYLTSTNLSRVIDKTFIGQDCKVGGRLGIATSTLKIGIDLRHNSIYKFKLGWWLPEPQLQWTVN
jgi:hypothetical protein